ncbi:MAG TPA: FtsX-like permease family protein, partial [Pyrinomonadaceae bacterium]|nr:FtsX-like permease family protein [Pyrinomonadaceae bacterium]
VRTLVDFMDESLLMLRFASILTGLFGALAMVLALLGVFSVINYSTSRRTREIGIRLALGAQRRDILKLIMNEGLFIVGVGVVIGLLAAIAGGRLIASLMFGNSGADAAVYVAISVLLIAVAMFACFIPAYKATKVNPNDALRHE